MPAKASFAHARVVEGEGLHERDGCCFHVDVAEVAKASGRALAGVENLTPEGHGAAFENTL